MSAKRLYDNAFHKLEPSVHAQVERWRARRQQKVLPLPGNRPFLTLSRQFGCEAFSLAEALAERLSQSFPTASGWTVYDRALMEKIATDYQLSQKLLESLEKSVHRELDDYLTTLFSKESLQLAAFRGLMRTVRALALEGHCIIVGRGGAILARDLPAGFHIRFVAPFSWRVEKMMGKRDLTRAQGEDLVRQADAEREGYIRKYLGKDQSDSTFYHLTMNSERVPRDAQVELVVKLLSVAIR